MAAAACVWLTGPRGAGKSTIARGVVAQLRARGAMAVAIDEDEVSAHLDPADPVGAVAWVAGVLTAGGAVVTVALDVATRAERERARAALPSFVEVFVDPGAADDDYEEPFAPELRVPTSDRDAAASVAQVVSWLESLEVAGSEPRADGDSPTHDS